MRRSFLSTLTLLLIGLFILNCHASEEENIQGVLNQREEALRKRDLSLYLACISESYQDKGEDFAALQRRVAESFRLFDGIDYVSRGRSVKIDGNEARVFQEFDLSTIKGDKKSSYSGKESLLFQKEGGGWKIVKGL